MTLSSEVAINENNFPDPIFRDYVAKKCDTDGNGSLGGDEISKRTSINVWLKDIRNLKGIEYLTALQELDCSFTKISSIPLLPMRQGNAIFWNIRFHIN